MAPNTASYSSVNSLHSWRPGIFRRLPWTGLAALAGAMIGTGATIAILVSSNGALISDWRYRPTVFLSICYTISNILLNVGLSKGVTINWWRKGLREGTQLGDLHRYWDFGNSALAALLAGRHFNFIAFACIFVAIVPINGPLLQRSSSVGLETIQSAVDLTLPIANKIEYGTGYLSGRGHAVSLITDQFNPVVQAFYTSQDIAANDTGCAGSGKCSGRLPGAGFSVHCSSSSVPFDIVGTKTLSNGTTVMDEDAFNGIDVFYSQFGWGSNSTSNISLSVTFNDASPCSGTLAITNCTLRTATVLYPVIIDGNKSTISLDPSTDIFDDVVVNDIDYPIEPEQQSTLMGGYWFALVNRFGATTHMRFIGTMGYEVISTGSTGPQFADLKDVTDEYFGLCNLKFKDPTAYLLQQARELMFRAAIAGGNATNVQALQGASEIRTAGVYRSHYLFLALAVGTTVFAILVVLATFNGYWHLGREVTMSPLEIAKAFNAPLLAKEKSNAKVKELVEGAGHKPVRYGAVVSWDDANGHKHGSFDEITDVEQSQMHLEIADSGVCSL